MFLNRRSRTLVLFLLGTMLHPFGTFAQAPLTVTGVSDRQVLTDSAAFTVPSTPGHAYSVLLNGQSIPLDVNIVINKADYHEIAISRTNLTSGVVTNRLVKFIIRSSNRGTPETGLIEWLPYPTIDSTAAELAGAQLNIVTPEDYPLGMEIPVVAWIENNQGKAVRANATMTASGQNSIRLRRGVGSGSLAASAVSGPLSYAATIPGLVANKSINIEPTTTWTPVSGTLSGNVEWPNNSRISVTGSITVAPGSTLTIGEGTVVRLNSGVEVFIRGQLTINGTTARPVVFAPVNRSQPWGGLITTNAFPARIDANGAFFVNSGANQSWFSGKGYDTHLSQQACFVLDGATGNFTNCYFIDGRGQVGHGRNANLNLSHSLAQRFLTGGEYVGGTIIVDKSAFIEFPQEDGIVNASIADADNDGIYFTTGTHILTDSLFGWCKDDAIDSGSGGAGTVVVSNCWVESALHESLAWSGEGRQTWTYDTVLINSGQGIECGWSTGNNTPLCFAERLLTTGNSIGARYGDNYEGTTGLGSKTGFLTITNSFILHNYRDVFGRPWDNTWDYRAARMDIRSNYISTANSFHPSNTLWNPAAHAARLAPFMSTPSGAIVGIAVATWTNQLAMSGIFQGTPVRLSSFTTIPVTVNYTYSTDSETLGTGAITFAPGETVKRIFPTGFDAANRPLVRVTISNPDGGELTGLTTVTYVGTIASPTVRIWAPGTQGDIARVVDGLAAVLSIPSAQTVTVDYRFDIDGNTLTSGTLTFAPGQTVAWATPPGSPALTEDLIRFALSNPVNATFSTPTNVYLFKMVTAEVPPTTALIPRGAVWKYRDAASDPGATWRNTNYNDAAWLSGRAQLGFSNNEENDEATLIADNNQITSYFRTTFLVTNVAAFTNLSMWMLRDDAGVVHLNGREVYRSPNLPAFPTAIGYTTTSLSPNGENTIDTATLSVTNLLTGTNWAAVEIHQQAPDSSDVSFDFELTANPFPLAPPGLSLYMGSFSEGQLTFVWGDPTFVLEQTTQFDGASTVWTVVPGASPITITPVPGDPQRFFRLRR